MVDWYARTIAGDDDQLRETIVEALTEELERRDAEELTP